jgi:COP9 signalosome complex subunit 4
MLSCPAVVNENVSLVISRQLLTDFCTNIPSLPDSTAKAVYHFTLEKIQPRVISFEEQVSTVILYSLGLCFCWFSLLYGT